MRRLLAHRGGRRGLATSLPRPPDPRRCARSAARPAGSPPQPGRRSPSPATSLAAARARAAASRLAWTEALRAWAAEAVPCGAGGDGAAEICGRAGAVGSATRASSRWRSGSARSRRVLARNSAAAARRRVRRSSAALAAGAGAGTTAANPLAACVSPALWSDRSSSDRARPGGLAARRRRRGGHRGSDARPVVPRVAGGHSLTAAAAVDGRRAIGLGRPFGWTAPDPYRQHHDRRRGGRRAPASASPSTMPARRPAPVPAAPATSAASGALRTSAATVAWQRAHPAT